MAAEAAACLAMEEVWAALAAAEAAVGEAERGTAGEEVAGEMKGGLKLETALRAAHAPAISRARVCVCAHAPVIIGATVATTLRDSVRVPK